MIFKTRPTIELFVPQAIAPGGRFEAEVRLHAKQDVEVEHVHLDLHCRAGWTVGSGKSQVSRYDDLLGLRAKLFAGPLLTQGDHSFRASFELPSGLPSSFESGIARVNWSMKVEVSIPWWPDARSSHPIAVKFRDATRVHEAAPATYRQKSSSPGQPRIEASLTSSAIAPGGRIAGQVALYNFDPSSEQVIRIALRERDTLHDRGGTSRLRLGRAWFVRVLSPPGAHERPTPFEFLAPPDLAPSFDCPAFAHAYAVEVEVSTGLFSSSTLAIPVTVVPDPALREASMGLSAPSVGWSRMQEIGREVAERRGYTIDGARLVRSVQIGEVPIDLELRHESRVGEGTFLAGSLAFPRLGLSLSVEPEKGLARWFAADVEIGEPAWDREHRVSARDPAQAKAFLRALVGKLRSEASFESLGDDVARVWEPDAAQSAQSLDSFAAKVERIAEALAESIALVPPPSDVEPGEDWAALAKRLNGRFVPGDLAIDDAKLGGTEVHVQTVWDDGPEHRLELVPDPPLPAEVGFVLASPATELKTAPGLSPEVRALLARLPEDATELALGGGRIRIALPFATSEGGRLRARPLDIGKTVDLLSRVAPLFSVRQGPFR